MSVKKYTKKPVQIEAIEYTHENLREVMSFVGVCQITDIGLYIPTLEGKMLARPGDYIIKGVEGEFYPCKPQIFKATYDLT